MPPEPTEATLSPFQGDQLTRGLASKGGDPALSLVLDRLTGGVLERPDSPDAWVTAVRRLPAREAQYGDEVGSVDERLRSVLRERGVQGLYTHQTAAIEHALSRRNVVITTPTASGKTLCYNRS
jgi:DEAD/DEAH box helicase